MPAAIFVEAGSFEDRDLVTQQVSHAPIVVTANGEFSSQGWPGEGTFEEPFVIEDLVIEGTEE